MELDTSYNNIREVLSLLQKYKQKMIAHNDDKNFTIIAIMCNHFFRDICNREKLSTSLNCWRSHETVF
jgi:hypothetical protein